MKPLRAKLLFLAGTAAFAFAIPAAGQRDATPAPVLPPGFGDPSDPPAKEPPPKEPVAEDPAAPEVPEPARPRGLPARPLADELPIEDSAVEDLEALALQNLPPPIEIPEEARRPTNPVGALRPANWGLGLDAFGNANGRFLSGLMGRLDAPLPSRWGSILLRRALLSEVSAPPGLNEVDWVAERAWLLLRMGEADAARALVQAIDVDRFTPRMFTVAVQVALATADPAALCPLVGPGRRTSDEPVWPLADAMCAALEGDSSAASQRIDQARRRSGAGGIDLLLAEKVIGAGTNTRRAVTIEWEGVDGLNSWRFGLASATGLEIPEALMKGAAPAVWAWQARAPMVPLDQRVVAAERAAALGVFSHAALVEMHSLLLDSLDPSEADDSIGGRLRRAYAAGTIGGRMDAMQGLWGEGADRYGRFILTATAASRIPAAEERAERAEDLVASMMSAGLDRAAARWGGVVEGKGEDGGRAWSILAVGAPRPVVDLSAGRVEAFADEAGQHRGRMLVAALAGLGRLEDPASFGVNPAPRSRWSNLIAAAARSNQPGTVALLAGVGMQTANWRGVPPDHFYQMIRALREVGLEYEARMIAAEAMTRL
ncbi:MAG TPA: hypothetical protein VGB59_08870 [Allosphingosinicella sp.]|jgi:hypothetical protein